MPEPILTAENLSRSVEGRVLWRDFRLDLHPGESVAVTGPSGSGKSLLLRTLAGLDPIDGGEVRFEGRTQHSWPMPEYRARITYLPQRPALFEGTVLDNLRRPFALKVHRERVFDEGRARALLAELGRDQGFLSLNAVTLSGGEGEVLALVRTLLLSPRVLLLDEATASLDPTTAERAESLLSSWLRDDPARACVWVSHDPAQRARVVGREVPL